MAKTQRRNALVGAGALLAGFSALATAAEAAPGIPDNDSELIALVADLRAAVAAYNDDLTDDEQLDREAFAHIIGLIDRMVALPAAGFAGVAAKAGWMCECLAGTGGVADIELADSLAADLARLMPGTVASSS